MATLLVLAIPFSPAVKPDSPRHSEVADARGGRLLLLVIGQILRFAQDDKERGGEGMDTI